MNRILFLSPWFPYPMDNGSKIRIYHLLQALSKRHKITLLSFIRQGEQGDGCGLNGLGCSVQTVPWPEFAPARLKALCGFFTPVPRSVLDYPGLPAERIEYWARRALREWSFRPGPMWTYLRMLLSDPHTFRSAVSVG